MLERLSVLEATLDESDRAVEGAERARDRARTKLEDAIVDEAVLAKRDELEALTAATKVEAARVPERARNERELTEARAAVEAALENLGAGWTVERLEGFDDSIAVKSEISGRWRATLSKVEQAVSDANDSLATARRQAGEAEEAAAAAATRLAELDEELADRPASEAREHALREVERLATELEAQQRIAEDAPTDDLQDARAHLEDRRSRARELAGALRSKQNAEEQLPAARAMADDAAGQTQRGYLLPAALGIGSVVVAVVLALLELPLAASIVVAAAGVGGAAAWVLVLRMQGEAASAVSAERLVQQRDRAVATISELGPALELGASPGTPDVERYLDLLDDERRSLERDEDRLERATAAGVEVEQLTGELADAAEVAGLPKRPTSDDLEAARSENAATRELEAARAAAAEREDQLGAAVETQAKRVGELTIAAEQRQEDAADALAQWETWLEEHGLERSYDRETAGHVVDSVSSAKASVASLRQVERRAQELAEEQASYVAQVAALAHLLADGVADEDDVTTTATLLAKALADALADEQARDSLATALEDREAAVAAAIEARSAAGDELAAFLEQAGAADAAGLRDEVERSRQATTLEAEVDAARVTLTTLSGPGKALSQLIDDLQAVEDIADVQASLSDVAGQLGELDDRRDELNQEAGGLRTTREEMESDAEATELRQEREDVLSQLQAGAGRWSVLALAHHILSRSRSAYEAEHRPAVVEKAERFFADWTDGRYKRIIAPLGEDVRGIERIDGVEVPLAGISRGTSEQLYLALRFGLVQHFVETSGEALPIVMDDILVNFDPDRAERAARSIEELSKTCQVIYFTCHEGTPLEPDVEQPLPRIEVS